MLFCKKCQIEYEDDKRFCPQCGSFLIKKENLLPDIEDPEKTVEEKPKEKYICPDCKIIYEKTKACIRCSAEVVLLTSFQAKEESQKVQEPEAETKSSQVMTTRDWVETPLEHLICPVCKKEHIGGKSCIRCGAELVSASSPPAKEKPKPHPSPPPKKSEPKPPSPSKLEENLFQEETPDEPPSKKSVEEQLKKGRFLRKVKRDYPRTFLNVTGLAIICIAAGYVLWSTYSHVIPQKSNSSVPPPHKEGMATPTPVVSALPPSGVSPTETEETSCIISLLEDIRKANLRKDIDLFLSCYSKEFKDREGKKKSTLETWGNFNFLDLTYHLGNLSVSGDKARAKVEWLVRFSPKSGGQPQDSKTILDVVFKKEDGTWKIGEIKSGS